MGDSKPTSDEVQNAAQQFEEIGGLPEGATLDVFEVAGSIKWFDASKGFGFIVPDNGLGDILLHITCLRAGGYQTAYEGARVHCQVLRRPKGLQAFAILSMDESTAIHPSQLPTTHPCRRPARKRLGTRNGQVVQSHSWIWLLDTR